MIRRAASVGTVAVVVCVLAGCAALLSIEEGTLDESLVPDGSSAVTVLEDGAVVSVPPVEIPPSCADERPDDAHGLFVSPSGQDAPNCGTKDLPCATLNFVIERAKLVAPTTIV